MPPAFPEPWEWSLTNVHTDPHTYKFRGCTDTPHKSVSWLSQMNIFFNYSNLDTCLDGTVYPCGKETGLSQQKPMGFFFLPLHKGSSHLIQVLPLYVYVCACMHLSMHVCVDMPIHIDMWKPEDSIEFHSSGDVSRGFSVPWSLTRPVG